MGNSVRHTVGPNFGPLCLRHRLGTKYTSISQSMYISLFFVAATVGLLTVRWLLTYYSTDFLSVTNYGIHVY